ncbi:MAG: carboxylesterase family protein, partial [Caulobacteraceae bacterium]|nr:carboxylesterase family protein [Caulobacter sp.]
MPPATRDARTIIGMTEVETAAGRVAGVRDGRVWCWRGVPYAAAPTGTRRFRPPEPPEPW